MPKVQRVESENYLYCCFYPLCSFKRAIQMKNVVYPRKAAQQYLLKHEQTCEFDPSLSIKQSLSQNAIVVSSPFSLIPSAVSCDCVLLYRWDDKYKYEARMRDAALIYFALIAKGLLVWMPKLYEQINLVSLSFEQVVTLCKTVIVLVHPGDFKNNNHIVDNFKDQLLIAKNNSMTLHVFLFDTPGFSNVIPPNVSMHDVIIWLSENNLNIHNIRMHSFNSFIDVFANSVKKRT